MALIPLPVFNGPPTDDAGLSAETMIPDLLRRRPEARAVLDRYGLRGCGGPDGPYETLGFFARAHGVDQGRLLRELAEALGRGEVVMGASRDETTLLADTIYRRFFLGGIVIALTAGATWGAWLLWRIGLSGTFLVNPLQTVNAHGMAQISGWMGLFIMGFACQAFPRIWHASLAAPRLAAAVFAMMVGGIVAQAVGMLAPSVPLAMLGAGLQLVAVAAFSAQIATTYRRSEARFEPYIAFIMAALGWFLASTVMSGWHTWTTMTAEGEAAQVWYVATYQFPLRDLQVHGLALFMILGVSIRFIPALFGAPKVDDRRAWGAFGILVAAVLAEVGIFLAYRWTGDHAIARLLPVSWAMLAIGSAMVVVPWRPWRPFPETDRVAKFVRTAYGWLAISLAMLLLLPAYAAASGIPFSHAYYGAIRHAVTVGFVSQMIMGFAAKVVPTLNGVDPRRLTRLWGPYLLINAGCALRVTSQTLTDWAAPAYAVIGLSGTMEVVALAWWGAGLASLMLRGVGAAEEGIGPAPERIAGDHHPADVLDWFPETAPVFDRFGLDGLRRPILRRTVGRRATLAQAARMRGIALEELTGALNEARR
ncbi:DUF1858 domain-containing protein [Paludisphaera sp.]|uniref:DUF1858 domain-containing protein n=1 Tax=Paludisphaera sp. TaxID=2017432 RepID=UPI00301D06ED